MIKMLIAGLITLYNFAVVYAMLYLVLTTHNYWWLLLILVIADYSSLKDEITNVYHYDCNIPCREDDLE